jgi:hypothetical protein
MHFHLRTLLLFTIIQSLACTQITAQQKEDPQSEKVSESKQQGSDQKQKNTEASISASSGTRVTFTAEPSAVKPQEANTKSEALPKDEFDWGKWWRGPSSVEWLMLFATVFLILYAARNLKQIKEQAIATRQTLDVMIQNERAWIGAKTPRNAPKISATINSVELSTFPFLCKNCGATVARITSISTRYHVVPIRDGTPDLPITPTYINPPRIIPGGMLIVPNGMFDFYAFLENAPTSQEAVAELSRPLHEGRTACYAYALIRYETVHARDRILQVCYRWECKTVNKFVVGGPQGYNEAT